MLNWEWLVKPFTLNSFTASLSKSLPKDEPATRSTSISVNVLAATNSVSWLTDAESAAVKVAKDPVVEVGATPNWVEVSPPEPEIAIAVASTALIE